MHGSETDVILGAMELKNCISVLFFIILPTCSFFPCFCQISGKLNMRMDLKQNIYFTRPKVKGMQIFLLRFTKAVRWMSRHIDDKCLMILNLTKGGNHSHYPCTLPSSAG